MTGGITGSMRRGKLAPRKCGDVACESHPALLESASSLMPCDLWEPCDHSGTASSYGAPEEETSPATPHGGRRRWEARPQSSSPSAVPGRARLRCCSPLLGSDSETRRAEPSGVSSLAASAAHSAAGTALPGGESRRRARPSGAHTTEMGAHGAPSQGRSRSNSSSALLRAACSSSAMAEGPEGLSNFPSS